MNHLPPARASAPLSVAALSLGLAGAALLLLVVAWIQDALRSFAPWVGALVLVALGALIAVDSARRMVKASELRTRPMAFAALCAAAAVAALCAVGIALLYVST